MARATTPALMDVGLGVRPPYYAAARAGALGVAWAELLTENFLVEGGPLREVARQTAAHYPVALHGVSLSIGSAAGPERGYLRRLAALAAEVQPWIISDHLCWSTLAGLSTHELLPLPLTTAMLTQVARHVAQVQEVLGRQLYLENLSSYLQFEHADYDEPTFLRELARRTGCGVLLDINNVYVSACNHGWDAHAYLQALVGVDIGYFHLAGHERAGRLRIDTHDHAIEAEVWALLEAAVVLLGPRPVIIERDDLYPPLEELVIEATRARACLEAAAPEAAAPEACAPVAAVPHAGDADARLEPVADAVAQEQLLWQALVVREGAARAAVLPRIVDDALASREIRLDVYARMIRLRLHDALALDVPRTAALLDAWGLGYHACVDAYVRAHPPVSFTLRDLGRGFAEFLAAFLPVGVKRDVLVGMAELEWTQVEVFDARDGTPATRDTWLKHPDALPAAPLELMSAVRLVASDARVAALWAVVPVGYPAGAIEPAVLEVVLAAPPQHAGALSWRNADGIWLRWLEPDEVVLRELPCSFAALCEALTAWHAAADVPARASELLVRWTDDALLREHVR